MKAQAIYGPPGCGKTTQLLAEVKRLGVQGVPMEQVLLMSHTRAAAAELISRLPEGERPNIATMHSVSYRGIGLNYGQVVTAAELHVFMRNMGIPFKGARLEDSDAEIDVGDEFISTLSFAVNRMIAPEEAYHLCGSPGGADQFRAFVISYRDWKEMNALADFGDMLSLFLTSEGATIKPYRAILIDEAQDLSPLQWAVLDEMIRQARPEEVIVVGDDDQAIFTWGGADPAGMPAWEERHKAKRLVLSHSYRLPITVWEKAQQIAGGIKGRVPKEYSPTERPGSCARVPDLAWLRVDGSVDTLMLYRTHHLRKEIERLLINECVPFRALNGFPGMLDNKQAKAMRVLLGDHEPSKAELAQLNRALTTDYRAVLHRRGVAAVRRAGWEKTIEMPWWMARYFHMVDPREEPRVRLSTIHGAKGMEAERVILLNAMTERVVSGMLRDPDSELRTFYVAMTRAREDLVIVEGNEPHPAV
jgi:DNA helicase-2/ATP-dependent DNA helicase PcrA